jgi:predicted RNA-binding protein YlqC (UPF0109 family)
MRPWSPHQESTGTERSADGKSGEAVGKAERGGEMKDLIEYIAKALVDNPEEVRVTELRGKQTSVIELRVSKQDLGKVIGKQGRTATAIRTILGAASTKTRTRSVLEILP